jgi:hypothetical protein
MPDVGLQRSSDNYHGPDVSNIKVLWPVPYKAYARGGYNANLLLKDLVWDDTLLSSSQYDKIYTALAKKSNKKELVKESQHFLLNLLAWAQLSEVISAPVGQFIGILLWGASSSMAKKHWSNRTKRSKIW